MEFKIFNTPIQHITCYEIKISDNKTISVNNFITFLIAFIWLFLSTILDKEIMS